MHRHHVQKKPAGTTVDIGEFFSELLVRENVIDLSASSFRAGIADGGLSQARHLAISVPARRLRMRINFLMASLNGRSAQSNSDGFRRARHC
jgi:hypothetical protein